MIVSTLAGCTTVEEFLMLEQMMKDPRFGIALDAALELAELKQIIQIYISLSQIEAANMQF